MFYDPMGVPILNTEERKQLVVPIGELPEFAHFHLSGYDWTKLPKGNRRISPGRPVIRPFDPATLVVKG